MKDFKTIAKSFFEGFMIGTGVAFWSVYILGSIAAKICPDEDDISDLPEDVQEMLS